MAVLLCDHRDKFHNRLRLYTEYDFNGPSCCYQGTCFDSGPAIADILCALVYATYIVDKIPHARVPFIWPRYLESYIYMMYVRRRTGKCFAILWNVTCLLVLVISYQLASVLNLRELRRSQP